MFVENVALLKGIYLFTIGISNGAKYRLNINTVKIPENIDKLSFVNIAHPYTTHWVNGVGVFVMVSLTAGCDALRSKKLSYMWCIKRPSAVLSFITMQTPLTNMMLRLPLGNSPHTVLFVSYELWTVDETIKPSAHIGLDYDRQC